MADIKVSSKRKGHAYNDSTSILPFSSPLSADARPDEARRVDEASAQVGPSHESRTTAIWETDKGRQLKGVLERNEGFLLVCFSMLFMSVMSAAAKHVQNHTIVPAWQIICIRMFLTFVLCLPYLLHVARSQSGSSTTSTSTSSSFSLLSVFIGPSHPHTIRPLILLRSLSGFCGLFGFIFTLRYLPLSDAVSLTFLAPVMTGALAAVVLGEVWTHREKISALVGVSAVVLIAKPTFLWNEAGIGGTAEGRDVNGVGRIDGGDEWQWQRNGATIAEHARAISDVVAEGLAAHLTTPEERFTAVCVSMLGVLGACGAYLSIRLIGRRASPTHVVSCFGLYSSILAPIQGLLFHQPPVLDPLKEGDMPLWMFVGELAVIGIMGFLAQVTLTMGLQREKAGKATLGTYSLLLWSLAWEVLFFQHIPDGYSMLGSALIVGSAVWVSLDKAKEKVASQTQGGDAEEAIPLVTAVEGGIAEALELGQSGDKR